MQNSNKKKIRKVFVNRHFLQTFHPLQKYGVPKEKEYFF